MELFVISDVLKLIICIYDQNICNTRSKLSQKSNWRRVPVGFTEGIEVGTALGEDGITEGFLEGMEGAADGPAVGILGITLGVAMYL